MNIIRCLAFAFALGTCNASVAQLIASDVAIDTDVTSVAAGGFGISPQAPNTLAVYVDTSGNLRAVGLGGGASTLLWSGAGEVESFVGSPDETWVAFVVRDGTEQSGTRALYRVRTDGTALTQLVAPVPYGSGFGLGGIYFTMAESGSRLLFQVDAGSVLAPNSRVQTVTATGTPVTVATATQLGGGFVGLPAISDDGTRVIYATLTLDLVAQSQTSTLYSVASTGGTAAMLREYSSPLLAFALTPDGSRVVAASFEDVRSFPVAGGAGTLISGTVTPAPIMVESMLSPDGQWALFVESDGASSTLYRTSVSAGGPTEIASAEAIAPTRMGFSDDSARIFFITDPVGSSAITDSNLFVRPTTGSATPVEVTGAEGFVSFAYFTRDGARIVYGTAPTSDVLPQGVLATQLWSAAPSGGASVELSVAPGTGDITQFGLPPFPTGSVELFVADGKLYRVAAAGGTPVDLSSNSAGNETVYYALPTADGQQVVFQSGNNLRVIGIDGSGGGGPGNGGGGGGGGGGSEISSIIVPLLSTILED